MWASACPEYHYIVPGLEQAVQLFKPTVEQYPSLSRLLSRVKPQSVINNPYRLIAQLCNLVLLEDQDFPLAALLAKQQLQHHFPENSYWIQAVPVQLIADRDRLLLRKPSLPIGLTLQEQERLANQMLNHFADRFKQVLVTKNDGWLFELQAAANIRTVNHECASESPLDQMMPQGRDKATWDLVINEIQMMLHMHHGEQAIFNSLWFENNGCLPDKSNTVSNCLHTEECSMRALGEFLDCPVTESVETCIDSGKFSKVIKYDDALNQALLNQSVTDSESSLRRVDQHISDLFSHLKTKKISSINFYPANGLQFQFTGRDFYKFWLRNLPVEKRL